MAVCCSCSKARPKKTNSCFSPEESAFSGIASYHFSVGAWRLALSTIQVAEQSQGPGSAIISTHILDRIPLPRFQNSNRAHTKVSLISREIRTSLAKDHDCSEAMKELTLAVGGMLGLETKEIAHTTTALKGF